MDEIKDILSELGYSQIKDYASEYRMFPIYRQSDSPCLSVKKNSGFFIDYGRDIKGDFLKLIQISLNFKDKTKAKEWLSNKDIQFDEQKIRQKIKEVQNGALQQILCNPALLNIQNNKGLKTNCWQVLQHLAN